jgi:hypothetical protein
VHAILATRGEPAGHPVTPYREALAELREGVEALLDALDGGADGVRRCRSARSADAPTAVRLSASSAGSTVPEPSPDTGTSLCGSLVGPDGASGIHRAAALVSRTDTDVASVAAAAVHTTSTAPTVTNWRSALDAARCRMILCGRCRTTPIP